MKNSFIYMNNYLKNLKRCKNIKIIILKSKLKLKTTLNEIQ